MSFTLSLITSFSPSKETTFMNFLSFLSTLIDLVFPIPLKQIVKSEPVNACTPKKKNSQDKKKKKTL